MPDQYLQRKLYQEFQRPVFQNWDWQLLFICLATLLFEAVFVVFMARRPVEEYSQAEIARIQEQFASFIMAEEEPRAVAEFEPVSTTADAGREEPEVIEDETGDASSAYESSADAADYDAGAREGVPESTAAARTEDTRRRTRQAAAEARRQSREAVSRSVSSKGLLGLLTGSGGAAQGDAVNNVLSGSGNGNAVNRDLDQILSGVDGLQTQGSAGYNGAGGSGSGIGDVRGSRSGGRTSIDDLVSERSDMATASMSRQGDLAMESPSDVIGRGSKSAYRSPNAIREVLLGHVPAIRYCYERELKRNPELKGKISVRITVSADGHVTAVEILSSSINNTRVERCILARIRLWKDFRPIDPTEGSVTFRQVYTFGM